MLKFVAEMTANHGQGHQQSYDIEAPNLESANKKAEQIAKRNRAVVTEVRQVDEFDGE